MPWRRIHHLIKHLTIKMYWGSGGIASGILNLDTRGKWVVSFTPQPLYPQGRVPGTHCAGGWVGTRAGLDAAGKRKSPSPCRHHRNTLRHL